MPFRQSFSGDVFIAVPQLCSNISRSFLLLLFLFLFLSLFIFIYLRQSLCCVPCNASWNFKWNGVFSFLFYTYSLLLLSFTPLSLSLFLSLALFLYINYSTFWFPRSFFYWVEKRADWFAGRMRGSVCGCNKVGGPQTRRRSKMVAPCALDYFIIFLSHVPALPTMNRVVTNYVMPKRINISGQEEGYLGNYTLCSAVRYYLFTGRIFFFPFAVCVSLFLGHASISSRAVLFILVIFIYYFVFFLLLLSLL